MKHRYLARIPAFVFALTTLFILAPAAVRAQSDDFNDGNDAGWTRLDLRVVGTPSTYTFPSDGSGGSAYRFFSPAPTVSTFGPARALSYRPDGAHTNFTVAVDLLRWDNNLDQGFGTFARASNIGLGRSVGYFFNYNPHQFPNLPVTAGELQINRVTREVPLTIARAVINLDPARKYRLLATGFGSYLVVKVYDLADLTKPLASADVVDTNYSAGTVGLLAFSHVPAEQVTNSTSNADVTFDNFLAFGSAPTNEAPPLYHGAPQVIDSTGTTVNDIDDFTDHTYSANGIPNGSFADCSITRVFPRAIRSIKVMIVTGNADEIGYVGDILVTPESAVLPPCAVPGFVVNPVDVTSQVSNGIDRVTIVLRAKQLCGFLAGWGADTLAGRSNARLHWQVELAPANHPPIASAALSPLFQVSADDTNLLVLAANDVNATVVFDASLSSDVDADPLQYFWFDEAHNTPFGAGVRLTNMVAVGEHSVALVVSDGSSTATNRLDFSVITHAQAAAELIRVIEHSDFRGRNKQPVLASLNAAIRSLTRGQPQAAANQLGAFENKVRAQVTPFDPFLAEHLVQTVRLLANP